MSDYIVFIVLGWQTKESTDWVPWLKTELEKRGAEVIIQEALPSVAAPKRRPWVNELSLKLNKTSKKVIIIAHSIGCFATLHALEKLKDSVEKTILIAPVANTIQVRWAAKRSLNKIAIPLVIGKKPNLRLAAQHCKQFICYISGSDKYVSEKTARAVATQLGATIRYFPAAGHFGGKDGYQKFPEIITETAENLA